MGATIIDSLELQVVSDSKGAVSGIEALSSSLETLRAATKGGLGLKAVANGIKAINEADTSRAKGNIDNLVNAFTPLTELSKTNLTGYVTSLQKIPKVLEGLNQVDMGAFAAKMQEVATAMKPLADEMEKVANGFSAMPAKLQKWIKESENADGANKRLSLSFTDVYHKIKSVAHVIGNVGKKIYSAVEKSMDYTENMNLFSVAMVSYAEGAYENAQKVSDAMGIDTSEWIRAQGVFMTLSTGFGVTGDKASVMSENLTQLGYDLASFYNIDTEDAMLKLQSGLAGELEPLRRLGYDLSQAKLEATAAELGITKSVSAMTQAEKAQLRYYAIMTQVTKVHGDMARTLDDPANQMRVFKAQVSMAGREIGNLFIPALNAILPYATAAAKVIGILAQTIGSLFGQKKTGIEETTDNIVTNTDGIADGLGDANEEAKKLKSYMLGFDELNVINPDTGSAEESLGDSFDFELPTYDFMEGLAESKVAQIVEDMKEWLGITDDITDWSDLLSTNLGNILVTVGLIGVGFAAWKISKLLTSLPKLIKYLKQLNLSVFWKAIGIGAVVASAAAGAAWLIKNTDDTMTEIGAILSAAALGVGAILAFTGINLPLGIALMAVGAIAMGSAIALNTDKLSDDVKGVIAVITGAVSLALLAVGAILAFTGVNVPLGIALMAGGALTLATVVAPNWNFLVDALQGPVGLVTAIVGGALLALGAILAFTGVALPLGIALMAVGAISLATVVAVNWNAIVDALQGPVGLVTAIISGALLALGAILVFTGVGIPLGIGLMLAGAAGLATVVAVNWNAIVDALQGPIGVITAIISAALLVIGIILLFTGVGIPLGMGLILAGAAGLATVVAVNWDFLVDKVKGIWESIKSFWNTYIAPVFTKEWWLQLGINCINGLIAGFEGGINAIITAFENMLNFVTDGINKISFDIPDWLGGGHFGFDLPRLTLGRVSLPRFEEGGFPEQGQTFIAREAGPELVGNIGRRTAVVNNEQIVTSISGGVAEANEEQNMLLREQNSLLRAILEKDSGVYLDGKNLTNSVEKHQRERGRVLITGGVM